jgi:hypothetical protein
MKARPVINDQGGSDAQASRSFLAHSFPLFLRQSPACEEGQWLMDLREKGSCCPSCSSEGEGDRDEEL